MERCYWSWLSTPLCAVICLLSLRIFANVNAGRSTDSLVFSLTLFYGNDTLFILTLCRNGEQLKSLKISALVQGLLRRVKWRQTASSLSRGEDLHIAGGGTQSVMCAMHLAQKHN